MRIKRASIGIGLGVCLLTAGALVLSMLPGRTADDDKGILSGFLSRALSTPQSRVSIGLVQGALLSDSTISDIKIADRDGVWLEIDRVRFNWTRSALLFRKLQIDKLEIGTVRYLRPALPNEQPEAVSKEPLLPELPLKVEIKDFGLKELALGAPVLGTAASVSATGAATLGNPAEGLNLRFDARRLDAAGALAARVELVPDTQRLSLNLSVDEPANGIAAHALNIPGRPPVKLTFEGNGTLDSFNAQLAFTAGDDIGANGTAQIRRIDKERRLTVDMASRIEGLLPSLAAPVFAGTTRLNGSIGFADRGAITISPLTVASRTARLDINGGLTADQIADVAITVRSLPNAGDKTAAGGAALDAEIRTERGLADADDRLLADAVQAVAEADGGGCLAFAGRGRVDGGDEDQPAVLVALHRLDEVGRNLRLVMAVGQEMLGRDADLGADLLDLLFLGGARDLDVGLHFGHDDFPLGFRGV